MKKLNNKGFSLGEVLLAVLIVLLASGIVAGGIPAAARAYERVIDVANGQALLQTTITCLREELSTATNIKLEGSQTIYYVNEKGDNCYIALTCNNAEKTEAGIYLNYVGGSAYSRLLVSKEAASKKLHATYTSIEINGDIITFNDIKIYKGTSLICGVDEYEIKVLNK